MIGKILSERYQIIEKLGEGGMSIVYKAKDLRLGRLVTLKILKKELIQDQNFISRFWQEARSVASLSHPNIIDVYDIQEDQGTIFLVFEYFLGENIKELIEQKKQFSISEALNIIIDICHGLDYAHQKGIIHRDIKPQNILIDSNKKVKVTDFGIARLVTAETLTKTEQVIGSVHYFSPEQAKGEQVSFTSDIYSLGVIIFELLTGRLPFEGDNAIAVALKHIQESPSEPSKFNPQISPELDKVILKCLEKDPAKRYSKMSELLDDLSKTAKIYKISTKIETTQVMPRLTLSDLSKEKEAAASKPQARSRTAHIQTASPSKGWLFFVIILIILGGIFYWWQTGRVEVITPDLINLTLEEATKIAQENGLRIQVTDEIYSPAMPAGVVISQKPSFGTKIAKGGKIEVIISKSTGNLKVPHLIGVKLEDAQKTLAALGLKWKVSKEVVNPDIEAGLVVSQQPAPGTEAAENSMIFLEISLGPNAKVVPNVVGLSLSEAEKILKDAGLQLEKYNISPSAKIPKGNIISQSPEAKSATPEDLIIKVVVSSGFENLKAPNLIGLSVSEAREEANALGLDLIIEGEIKEDLQISSQNPPPDTLMTNNIIKVSCVKTLVVPNLVGKSESEAVKLIKKVGLNVGQIEYIVSKEVAPKTVVEQDPKADLEVPSNTSVDLVVVK